MKKVLIADDELLVRVGLKSTIPWEENGFSVVGEARNGKECIEIFDKVDPDILLTDIRMPIINGLELIQILKQRKDSLKAIILTHYDDFNYAKEAIKLGASEYILKPDLSSEHLLGILRKISCEIDNTSKTSANLNNESLKEGIELKINGQALLEDIVNLRYTSQLERENIIKRIEMALKNSCYIISCSFAKGNETSNSKISKVSKTTIESITSSIFNDGNTDTYIVVDNNYIFHILNIKNFEDKSSYLKSVINYFVLMKNNLLKLMNLDVEIGISDVGYSALSIPKLLEEAKKAQKLCFFEDSEIVLFTNSKEADLTKKCPQISLEVLKTYIKTLDKEQLNSYIHSIFSDLSSLRKIEYVKEVFNDFISYAKVICNELNITNSQLGDATKFSYSNMEKLTSLNMMCDYICSFYGEFIRSSKENRNYQRYTYVINKSIEYVKNNYARNISLADVADHVEISRSYLSFLFKEETGINLSNYIINYRIEKSKKLLMESNLKMYEIAEQVGFDNPYYFSKVFKDVTGYSCKEFKKLNYN